MLQTCALYGGASYVNSWLGINFAVILAGIFVVTLVYMLSRFLPSSMKGKITSVMKVELTQLFISVIIIVVLIGAASTACAASTSISQHVTHTTESPFAYSDYYIGNLTLNTGLRLLTNVYLTSIDYGIDSRVYPSLINYEGPGFLSHSASILSKSAANKGIEIFSVGFNFGEDLGANFGILSDLYLAVFGPIITLVIGSLFVQYLSIPIFEYTAFTIVLPVALIMRSIAYSASGSGGLRSASNAVLAIAIAVYLIYPLMISYNSYIVNWIFSVQNPYFQYLHTSFTIDSLPTTFFSSLASGVSGVSLFGVTTPSLNSLLGNYATTGVVSLFDPFAVTSQVLTTIDEMAQFIFVGIFLFGLDVAVTLGFAQSLASSLDAGIEGAASFWGNV
ncbi:MAG: hypothetical protein M1164_01650 [Candidatus Marsarchaeota archaeon]|nr:hypothetical protein [Candidatus Marsarchaeota archaeon]